MKKKNKTLKIFFTLLIFASASTSLVVGIYYSFKNSSKILRIDNQKNNKPTLGIDQSIDIFSQENLEKFKTFFKEYLYSKNYSRIKYYIDIYRNENYINNAINDSFKKIKESSEFLNIINFNSQQEIQQEFINICEKNINLFCLELSKKLNWNYNFVYMIFNDQISDEKFIEVNDAYNNMISVEYNKNLYIKNLSVQNEKISWLKEQSKTESSDLENMAYEYAKKEVEEYKNNSSIFQEALLVTNRIFEKNNQNNDISINSLSHYKLFDNSHNYSNKSNNNSNIFQKLINYILKKISDDVKEIKDDIEIIVNWVGNNQKIENLIFKKIIDFKGEKINFISFICDIKKYNINEIIMIFKNVIQYITGREYNSFKSIAAEIYSLDLISLKEPLNNIIQKFKSLKYIPNFITNILEKIYLCIKSLVIFADVVWNPYSFGLASGVISVACGWPLFSFINSIINGPSFDCNNISNVIGGVFNLVIGNVFQIVLNPILNTTELIIFCQENNITFWEWAKAHWECIKNNWATALDPLNWFHSCIKQLVKSK